MTIESLPLTAEQVGQMASEADWLKLTPEQREFIEQAGEGRICMFYGNEILRMPAQRAADIMAEAFRFAMNSALKELGVTRDDEFTVETFQPVPGGDLMRVKVTTADGKTATGIGRLAESQRTATSMSTWPVTTQNANTGR